METVNIVATEIRVRKILPVSILLLLLQVPTRRQHHASNGPVRPSLLSMALGAITCYVTVYHVAVSIVDESLTCTTQSPLQNSQVTAVNCETEAVINSYQRRRPPSDAPARPRPRPRPRAFLFFPKSHTQRQRTKHEPSTARTHTTTTT
jgi:hypothetical protein